MSLLIKFPDERSRSEFLAMVAADSPHLMSHLFVSEVLPHVYTETQEDEDLALRRAATLLGEVFEDVRFTPVG